MLVETFVDPSRFAGTCYRAANWLRVGQTVARPTAYPNGKVAEGPKDIYLYPLQRRLETGAVRGAEGGAVQHAAA